MKRIIRTISGANLANIIPNSPYLIIESIYIGVESHVSSSTNPIKADVFGNLSGGGTTSSTYYTFDFGFAARNTSSERIQVRFFIEKTDIQDYVIETKCISEYVDPGSKIRVWAGLRVEGGSNFRFLRIKEIHISSTPPTAPNKSIFDVFSLKNNPLPSTNPGCVTFLCLPITIVGSLSFMCLPWIINYFNDPTVFAKDPTGLATANAIAKTIFQLPLPLVITLQIIASIVIAIIYFTLFSSKWTAYLMSLFMAYFFFSLMKQSHSSDGWAWFVAVWTFVSGVTFHRQCKSNTPQFR